VSGLLLTTAVPDPKANGINGFRNYIISSWVSPTGRPDFSNT